MKIILHIGQSKTGTSAIQSYLSKNRELLIGHGILYPFPNQSGVEYQIPSHNALADALLNVRRYPFLTPSQYFESFFRSAEQLSSHTMILSAEHFWGSEPRAFRNYSEEKYWEIYEKKIQSLSEFLSGHKTELVLYLRPQEDWFLSTWAYETCFLQASLLESGHKEWVIDQYCSSVDCFFSSNKFLLNYKKRLDFWRKNLDVSEYHVVSFHKSNLKHEDIVSDFISRLQLPLKPDRTPAKINRSIEGAFVDVKRSLNKKPKSLPLELTIIEALRFLSDHHDLPKNRNIGSELRKKIEDFVYTSNLELAVEYGVGLKILNHKKQVDRTDSEFVNAFQLYRKEIRRPYYGYRYLRHLAAFLLRHYIPSVHANVSKIKNHISLLIKRKASD